jgi:hypothetical protein
MNFEMKIRPFILAKVIFLTLSHFFDLLYIYQIGVEKAVANVEKLGNMLIEVLYMSFFYSVEN